MKNKSKRSKKGIRTAKNYDIMMRSLKRTSSAYGSGSKSFVGGDGGVGNSLMEQYIRTKYITYGIFHPIYNPSGIPYGYTYSGAYY